MKLRSEFEVVRGALLNRNLVPSLDTCVSEFLREKQRLFTQGVISCDAFIFESAKVAYASICDKSTASLANNLDILLVVAVRSFVITANNRVILLQTIPHILHDKHKVQCKHSVHLPLLVQLMAVLHNLK